eukprot:scaffold302114_cov21-Tisochrysis_lutea.AAC.1
MTGREGERFGGRVTRREGEREAHLIRSHGYGERRWRKGRRKSKTRWEERRFGPSGWRVRN